MIRYLGLSLLALVVIISSAFLTDSLEASAGYRAFVAGAARAGQVILISAVIILVTDLLAMVIYVIRHGETDDQSDAVTEDGPLPLSLGTSMGRSQRKSLGRRSEFISMESLVDGSATFGDRIMVLGICTLFASFLSIFAGVGLMLMKDVVILGLFPVIPGIVVFQFARSALTDYREAKRKFRTGPAR